MYLKTKGGKLRKIKTMMKSEFVIIRFTNIQKKHPAYIEKVM